MIENPYKTIIAWLVLTTLIKLLKPKPNLDELLHLNPRYKNGLTTKN